MKFKVGEVYNCPMWPAYGTFYVITKIEGYNIYYTSDQETSDFHVEGYLATQLKLVSDEIAPLILSLWSENG